MLALAGDPLARGGADRVSPTCGAGRVSPIFGAWASLVNSVRGVSSFTRKAPCVHDVFRTARGARAGARSEREDTRRDRCTRSKVGGHRRFIDRAGHSESKNGAWSFSATCIIGRVEKSDIRPYFVDHRNPRVLSPRPIGPGALHLWELHTCLRKELVPSGYRVAKRASNMASAMWSPNVTSLFERRRN